MGGPCRTSTEAERFAYTANWPEVGSMAKASERLALSQPAISKAISDMEQTFEALLLNRTSRGVKLTKVVISGGAREDQFR